MNGSSGLEKLFFVVSLMDKVTGPSKTVCKSLRHIQHQSKISYKDIGSGALSIASSFAALSTAVVPAQEFQDSLNQVASLDVPAGELDQLSRASKRFAMRFGEDASSVAASAYDIQSAIPGLKNGALAAFTYNAAILAKAGKSNSATITKYFGTMYNIFEDQAEKVGQGKWIEALSGKTAYAIKIFKTTGDDMSAAFTNLGSSAKMAGISMDEQLAVLGNLQGTMGGANAGTAYKAFLNTVGKAQLTTRDGETLKFTDQSGKLLPMVQILEKIRAAVGPGQLKLSDQTKLMQAFGDEGGKAVMNLLDKTENLKSSISGLEKINDASGAEKMAEKMVDPFQKLQQSIKVFRITLGQGILPILTPMIDMLSALMRPVVWIIDTVPALKYIIGGVILSLFALFNALAGYKIMKSVIRLTRLFYIELNFVFRRILGNTAAVKGMTLSQKICALVELGWSKIMKAHLLWTKLLTAAQAVWAWVCGICAKGMAYLGSTILWTTVQLVRQKIALIAHSVAGKICSGTLWTVKIAMTAFSAVSWMFTTGIGAASAAVWSFAAALWATGIPEIILVIAALIGAVIAVCYWFDDLNKILPGLGDYLLFMLGPVGWIAELFMAWDNIPGIFTRIWAGIKQLWGYVVSFWDWLSGIGSALGDWLWKTLVDPYLDAFRTLKNMIASVIGWAGKIGSFFGISIGGGKETKGAGETKKEPVVSAPIEARKSNDVPAGGIRNSANTTNNNWGGVTINAPGGITPSQLEEWAMMQA